MSESWRTCNACGRELETTTGQPLSAVLSGWYVLSRIRDDSFFDRISFCSQGCLADWVHAQQAEVPEVFRRSFNDDLVC